MVQGHVCFDFPFEKGLMIAIRKIGRAWSLYCFIFVYGVRPELMHSASGAWLKQKEGFALKTFSLCKCRWCFLLLSKTHLFLEEKSSQIPFLVGVNHHLHSTIGALLEANSWFWHSLFFLIVIPAYTQVYVIDKQ